MTDRFADKVSSDIGRSDTQWVDGTLRGDEAKGCLLTQVRAKSCEAPLSASKLYRGEVVLKNVF